MKSLKNFVAGGIFLGFMLLCVNDALGLLIASSEEYSKSSNSEISQSYTSGANKFSSPSIDPDVKESVFITRVPEVDNTDTSSSGSNEFSSPSIDPDDVKESIFITRVPVVDNTDTSSNGHNIPVKDDQPGHLSCSEIITVPFHDIDVGLNDDYITYFKNANGIHIGRFTSEGFDLQSTAKGGVLYCVDNGEEIGRYNNDGQFYVEGNHNDGNARDKFGSEYTYENGNIYVDGNLAGQYSDKNIYDLDGNKIGDYNNDGGFRITGNYAEPTWRD